MIAASFDKLNETVAPLAGSVDRNMNKIRVNLAHFVAPLAGSVDRNKKARPPAGVLFCVAPLAGSVDRNAPYFASSAAMLSSLPSRGAWIEMFCDLGFVAHEHPVAPLAGSVDRNSKSGNPKLLITPSLPSRGAWIEIRYFSMDSALMVSLPSRGAWIEIAPWRMTRKADGVAPLAGSVDRNGVRIYARCMRFAVAPLAGSVDRNDADDWDYFPPNGRSPRGERG